MQLRPEAVVLFVVVAVVIVGNDVAFVVQQPKPRVNRGVKVHRRARHIRIKRDMQQRLAVKGQGVVVIRFFGAEVDNRESLRSRRKPRCNVEKHQQDFAGSPPRPHGGTLPDMSKAKQKGTTGENEILALLQDAGFPDAHRTEASRESHDIWCGPFTVEVKFRKTWALFDWIPKLRKVAGDQPWVLFAIHGDRRTDKGRQVGRVAVLDADFAAELMQVWCATLSSRGRGDRAIRGTDGSAAAVDGLGQQDPH